MTTYYLSGPMEGHPEHNYPLFLEVEEALSAWLGSFEEALQRGAAQFYRGEGFEIDNPARHFTGTPGDRTREEYMQADIQSVLDCDVIVLLPGWQYSEGARDEHRVAKITGKRFMLAMGPERGGWEFVGLDNPPGLSPFDQTGLPPPAVRTFATGATRDLEDGKWDFEAFLSPLVLDAFAEYMHKHRVRQDGSLRDGDDWQKGIPRDVYMKSMWRHFMDVWRQHRGLEPNEEPIESLMALLFNVQGYAFELLRGQALRDAYAQAAATGRVEVLDG